MSEDFNDFEEFWGDGDERDFLGRKVGKGHTFRNDTNRSTGRSSGLSSMFNFGNVNRGVDVSKLTNILKSMFTMMSVAHPERVITTKASSKNQIELPTHILKNKDGELKKDSTTEEQDAFYGGSILNACDNTFDKNNMQLSHDFRQLASDGNLSEYLSLLLHEEGMQRVLAEKFPGYSDFVGAYKEHMYGRHEELDRQIMESDNEYYKVLNMVTKIIRYPSEVTEEEWEQYKGLAKFIEDYLKWYDVPDNARDANERGKVLSQEVLKYVQMPEDERNKDKGEEEGEGEGAPEGFDGSGKDGGEFSDAVKAMMQTTVRGGSAPDAKDAEGEEMQKGGVGADDELPGETSPDDDGIIEKMKKEFEDDKEKVFDPKNPHVKFHKGKSNKIKYQEELRHIDMVQASVLKKLFQRKIRDYKKKLKSMRSGYLDTDKLAEAKQGVQTIYEKTAHVTTNKVTVGILIDESGSMYGNEITNARRAAIYINEAFGKIPDVDLFIYGHTADLTGRYDSRGSTDIYIYKEPTKGFDKFALGSVQARSNNRDGEAILYSAKRIRTMTSNPGVLLVISDGAPAASGYGNGIQHTRESVIKVEKTLGFNVVQVAINNYVPSEQMFKHFVKFTDIKQFPKDLANYMRKHLDKMVKATTKV